MPRIPLYLILIITVVVSWFAVVGVYTVVQGIFGSDNKTAAPCPLVVFVNRSDNTRHAACFLRGKLIVPITAQQAGNLANVSSLDGSYVLDPSDPAALVSIDGMVVSP